MVGVEEVSAPWFLIRIRCGTEMMVIPVLRVDEY